MLRVCGCCVLQAYGHRAAVSRGFEPGTSKTVAEELATDTGRAAGERTNGVADGSFHDDLGGADRRLAHFDWAQR